MISPKLLPVPTYTTRRFPCPVGPLLDFVGESRRLAAEQQLWWEQQCPICRQHYRFLKIGSSDIGYLPIAGYTNPDQGNRALPVDPWLMALQIAREKDAA